MTASTDRPWWASDGPVDGGVAPDEDPLTCHRRARHGGQDPDAPSDGPTGVGDDPGPAEDEEGSAPPDHDVDVCGICPVCAALRSLQASRPELAGHLAEAARHLAAALRELVDDPTAAGREGAAGDAGRPSDRDRVQRIDLD